MRKILIFGVIALVLDQLTKFFVNNFVSYGLSVNVIHFFDCFNIVNLRNTGMAFSIFPGRNLLFSLFIFMFLLSLLLWLYKDWNKLNKVQQYAFCLIIVGGFGNFIDRLFRGAVVDFLDFGIKSLRWPSFNIADSYICLAMMLIIINILMPSNKQKV
ncbi:MAG: signal peptidase II [Endomicrobium sp.]|nr:signal peptidase II [Endomicrobium sp.]